MTKPLTLAAVKRLVAAGESETLELKRTTRELREAILRRLNVHAHRRAAKGFR